MDENNNISLSQWLKHYDKRLYNAIEEACALNLLRQERGSNGITMLYPINKTLRNKIITLLEYNDLEGLKIIQSMIIVDYLPTTYTWHDKKDDIPNKLGQLIEVASIDTRKIMLANGSILKKLYPENNTKNNSKNVAVWGYSIEDPPSIKGKKATHKYVKKGAKSSKKTNNYQIKNNITPYKLSKICEVKSISLLNNRNRNYMLQNPYINFIISYIKYLNKIKKHDKEIENVLNDTLLKLSYSPEASFYIIFEPYCNSSKAPKLFYEWIKTTKGVNLYRNSSNIYKRLVEKASTLEIANKKRKEVCKLRQIVMDDLYPAGLRKALNQAYSNDVKAQHDEIRFLIHEKMYDIIMEDSSSSFKDLIFDIEIMQRNGYKNGRTIITSEISSSRDQLDIASFYSTAVTFILSDCFLYVPYSSNKKYEFISELSCNNQGYEMESVILQELKLTHLTEDLHLIITQEPYYQFLERSIKDQSENSYNNIQSQLAENLNDLVLDDIDNIGPELKETIKKLFPLLFKQHEEMKNDNKNTKEDDAEDYEEDIENTEKNVLNKQDNFIKSYTRSIYTDE